MEDLRAAVEATLQGKDERLVAKCDVPGILAVFERWDIYDVNTLSPNLASSFAELQRDLAPVAALSFLALLKATIGRAPWEVGAWHGQSLNAGCTVVGCGARAREHMAHFQAA